MTLEQQIAKTYRSIFKDELSAWSNTLVLRYIDGLWDTLPFDWENRHWIERFILAAPLAERLTSPYAFIRNTGGRR